MKEKITPAQLENSYMEFTQNFPKWMPDGVTNIDLALMAQMGVLEHGSVEEEGYDKIAEYFNVIETADKVTLFNDKFAIWIVPKLVDNIPKTLTFIALLTKQSPHLEVVFCTEGVYNTPRYILKILHHFLNEVADTEKIISSIDKPKAS